MLGSKLIHDNKRGLVEQTLFTMADENLKDIEAVLDDFVTSTMLWLIIQRHSADKHCRKTTLSQNRDFCKQFNALYPHVVCMHTNEMISMSGGCFNIAHPPPPPPLKRKETLLKFLTREVSFVHNRIHNVCCPIDLKTRKIPKRFGSWAIRKTFMRYFRYRWVLVWYPTLQQPHMSLSFWYS